MTWSFSSPSPPIDFKDNEYITELPARRCPKCGIVVTPVIKRSEKLDPQNGYTYIFPCCGSKCGHGGKLKSLFDENGKRILSSNWSARRLGKTVCQFCGCPQQAAEALGGHLEVHHIVPVSKGGDDTISNLVVLCSWCHVEAHKRIDFWAYNKRCLIDRMYEEYKSGTTTGEKYSENGLEQEPQELNCELTIYDG